MSEQEIKEMVKERIAEKATTIYQLGATTGINRSTIKRWLDGDISTSLHNFIVITKALDIEVKIVCVVDRNQK